MNTTPVKPKRSGGSLSAKNMAMSPAKRPAFARDLTQKQRHLPQSGSVDPPDASRVNLLLDNTRGEKQKAQQAPSTFEVDRGVFLGGGGVICIII